MNIKHQDDGVGNIYVSDYSGIRYSLSLENNVRDSRGFTDFISIKSMEGSYVANILVENKNK